MSRLNVIVVDDSEVCRTTLRTILEAEHDIRVVAEAADGLSAIHLIQQLKPDLATIDIMMPGIGGLDLIERIMARQPLPILVVTGMPTGPGSDIVFQAVRRGALDVAEKPGGERTRAALALREKVRLLAKLSVVRHVAGFRRPGSALPASIPARLDPPPPTPPPQPSPVRRDARGTIPPRFVRVVAIAASAGGPQAVATVLGHFSASFPACIALVQHIPSGFTNPFANFLRGATTLQVKVVEERTLPVLGTILIAADDRHLIAESTGTLSSTSTPPVRGHRPSADVLLTSVARAFGGEALGVVLTGIGDDGTVGLLDMRTAGAITMAQDEASSAVFGMPKAAAEAGAASLVLPLAQIGPEILRILSRNPGAGTPGRGRG